MILNRLGDYLLYKNLSFNKFEKSLSVSHGSISNAFKRQKNIGSNVIENILNTYPEISAEWLLRGTGEMLNSNDLTTFTKRDLLDKELNDKLIQQVTQFFNFKNRNELQEFLNRSTNSDMTHPLEQMILKVWENKYGQELKTIKLQLMTLFTSQLDYQMKSDKRNSESKTG
jgi:hypothetical protein